MFPLNGSFKYNLGFSFRALFSESGLLNPRLRKGVVATIS